MHQLPCSFGPGDLVRARGQAWRVWRASAFADCTLIALAGAEAANHGVRRTLILPFDRFRRLERDRRPRVVRRRRWMALFRLLASESLRHGDLAALGRARLEILAYQAEPALAVVSGLASRLLLADDVGLGKTVQAGLILAELRARGLAGRVLVLTPAGLREQWREELAARFGIDAALVDAAALRRALALQPSGENPWRVFPIAIASLDFVKRPEVVRGLEPFVWDLLIVDEAHNASGGTERAAAVRGLAARARHVVLLTATPHAGDETAFAALCDIGRLGGDDEGALIFRRRRDEVGLPVRRRRVRLLAVRGTAAEARLHALLNEYTKRAWREAAGDRSGARRLAMAVLQKRALSSAASLARSIGRRLASIGPSPGAAAIRQLGLPLDEDDPDADDGGDLEPEAATRARGLDDPAAERAFLQGLLDAAAQAASGESKLAALGRLLRRTTEPAIVFTEFRDTARLVAGVLARDWPVGLLHGGLEASERRLVERAFAGGRTRVLVATDVASEGLNLQASCRLVIDLELPWNPMRLEQRIGRVDRIGQTRRVHALHLVAAGTGEEAVLARLAARLLTARRAIGHVPDPLGLPTDAQVAEALICGTRLPEPPPPGVPGGAGAPAARVRPAEPGLGVRAEEEADRARAVRRLLHRGPTAHPDRRPCVAVLDPVRRGRLARRLDGAPGLVCVFRIRFADARGQVVEDTPLALFLPAQHSRPSTPREVHRLLEAGRTALAAVERRAAAWSEQRLAALAAGRSTTVARLQAREAAITRQIHRDRGLLARPIQAGLFDRRAARQVERRSRTRAALDAAIADGRAADLARVAPAGEPELALLLFIV